MAHVRHPLSRLTVVVPLVALLAVACDSRPAAAPPAPSPQTSGVVVPGGAAIAPAVKPAGTTVTGQIATAGGERSYRVYVPRSLPAGRPVPLLIGLHGALGSGQQFERDGGFDGLAEANHFIAAYPDGAHRVWNAGTCCGPARKDQGAVDDVGFISALIGQLEQRYDVDRGRVYVTGHSNGAMMAFRLACQLADQVAAIAVQSGALLLDGCTPDRPVAAMEIHGTADQTVPIDGGQGRRSAGGAGSGFPPAEQGPETLAAVDGCPAQPASAADGHNGAVTFQVWQPCRQATTVEWAKVEGADHAWMGHHTPPGEQRLVGTPYMGFDSSAAVWSFLAARSRP